MCSGVFIRAKHLATVNVLQHKQALIGPFQVSRSSFQPSASVWFLKNTPQFCECNVCYRKHCADNTPHSIGYHSGFVLLHEMTTMLKQINHNYDMSSGISSTMIPFPFALASSSNIKALYHGGRCMSDGTFIICIDYI